MYINYMTDLFIPSSFGLLDAARERSRRAEDCLRVAGSLEVRRALLATRPEAVVALHTDAVWMGRAAAASRETLRQRVVQPLHFLGLDVAAIVRRLRSHAAELEREAYELRRAAEEAEAARRRNLEAEPSG